MEFFAHTHSAVTRRLPTHASMFDVNRLFVVELVVKDQDHELTASIQMGKLAVEPSEGGVGDIVLAHGLLRAAFNGQTTHDFAVHIHTSTKTLLNPEPTTPIDMNNDLVAFLKTYIDPHRKKRYEDCNPFHLRADIHCIVATVLRIVETEEFANVRVTRPFATVKMTVTRSSDDA